MKSTLVLIRPSVVKTASMSKIAVIMATSLVYSWRNRKHAVMKTTTLNNVVKLKITLINQSAVMCLDSSMMISAVLKDLTFPLITSKLSVVPKRLRCSIWPRVIKSARNYLNLVPKTLLCSHLVPITVILKTKSASVRSCILITLQSTSSALVLTTNSIGTKRIVSVLYTPPINHVNVNSRTFQ